VVELPTIYKALGSIPNTAKNKTKPPKQKRHVRFTHTKKIEPLGDIYKKSEPWRTRGRLMGGRGSNHDKCRQVENSRKNLRSEVQYGHRQRETSESGIFEGNAEEEGCRRCAL
jgi:hypothetical protein